MIRLDLASKSVHSPGPNRIRWWPVLPGSTTKSLPHHVFMCVVLAATIVVVGLSASLVSAAVVFSEDFSGHVAGNGVDSANGWFIDENLFPFGNDRPSVNNVDVNLGPDNYGDSTILIMGSGGTRTVNPANISGGLNPSESYTLSWDWKVNTRPGERTHGTSIGFQTGGGTGTRPSVQVNEDRIVYNGIMDMDNQFPIPSIEALYGIEMFVSATEQGYRLFNSGGTEIHSFSTTGDFTTQMSSIDSIFWVTPSLSVLTDNADGGLIDNLLLEDSSVSLSADWAQNQSGDWNTGTNWIGGSSPNANQSAVLGSAISQLQTVFTNTAVTVNDVQFANSSTYIVAGGGTVNLTAGTAGGLPTSGVSVTQGSHQFQAAVNVNSTATIDVGSGASLEFVNRLNLNNNIVTKTGDGTLVISNTLNSGSGTLVCQTGECSGSGNVGGDLNNSGGTVSPGNSPGVMSAANFSQGAAGSLLIELSGTEAGDNDLLDVAGLMELDGSLVVALLDGFLPANGDSFDILDFATLAGSFDSVALPALTEGLAWDASDLYASGSLSVVPEPSVLALGSFALCWLLTYRSRQR